MSKLGFGQVDLIISKIKGRLNELFDWKCLRNTEDYKTM